MHPQLAVDAEWTRQLNTGLNLSTQGTDPWGQAWRTDEVQGSQVLFSKGSDEEGVIVPTEGGLFAQLVSYSNELFLVLGLFAGWFALVQQVTFWERDPIGWGLVWAPPAIGLTLAFGAFYADGLFVSLELPPLLHPSYTFALTSAFVSGLVTAYLVLTGERGDVQEALTGGPC